MTRPDGRPQDMTREQRSKRPKAPPNVLQDRVEEAFYRVLLSGDVCGQKAQIGLSVSFLFQVLQQKTTRGHLLSLDVITINFLFISLYFRRVWIGKSDVGWRLKRGEFSPSGGAFFQTVDDLPCLLRIRRLHVRSCYI